MSPIFYDDGEGVVEEEAEEEGGSCLAGAETSSGGDGADGRIASCVAGGARAEVGSDGLCG